MDLYYPRPLLQRDSFLSLDGKWDFAVTRSTCPPVFDRQIRVPFAPECKLSGIEECYDDDTVLWYRRRFVLPDGFQKDRVLLHFEAVDQCACVLLNGAPVGEHRGGYIPFTLDITEYLQEENELAVRVTDRLDGILPYGKQKRKRGGMWYTPTTGIWQSVWLESVVQNYITHIDVTASLESAVISVQGVAEGEITLQTPQGELTFPLHGGRAEIAPDHPRHWSPEDPYLYYFTVRAGEDEVASYFALRTVDTGVVNGIPRLLLNGKPYFFHGLLDQGYWAESGMTPPAPDRYARDILQMKSLGFNMLRKHIKVEGRRFYYECDRLGMAVFQDMVNNSDYSFLRDTALPTVGLLKRNDKHLHKNDDSRQAFLETMEQTVNLLKGYPCICSWTIFNEGWGQFDATAAYRRLRRLDPGRPIDSASGWFMGGETDLDSRHVYFRKVRLTPSDKPLFLSEFGGLTYKVEGHVFDPRKSYGYGTCKSREELAQKLCDLYREQILPLIPKGLCATVYTQVSDVEEEINGLVTYDRQVLKIKPEEFSPLSDQLKNAINKGQ